MFFESEFLRFEVYCILKLWYELHLFLFSLVYCTMNEVFLIRLFLYSGQLFNLKLCLKSKLCMQQREARRRRKKYIFIFFFVSVKGSFVSLWHCHKHTEGQSRGRYSARNTEQRSSSSFQTWQLW